MHVTRAFQLQTRHEVRIESVGGVDAAKRISAGERFDLVLLASNAIDKLLMSGHLNARSKTDWVLSAVALAVPAHQAPPDISTDAALKNALLAAASVSYSTGPSGDFLAQLFTSWGISDVMGPKLLVPPPGVPVGRWVASGQAALGFQQRSELLGVEGITVVGDLQGSAKFVTTFSAAMTTQLEAEQAQTAADFLAFLNAPAMDGIKYQHGMSPIY